MYSSLDLNLVAEKYFEYNEDMVIPIDSVRNTSRQISSIQSLSIQGDRAFQGLKEYLITYVREKRITV